MKKITPAVTDRVIEHVKEKMEAKEAERDARIEAFNNKVTQAHPDYRASEPEIKEEDRDPSKSKSDSAVEEMKAKRKEGKEEVDPKLQLTAQVDKAKKQVATSDKKEAASSKK